MSTQSLFSWLNKPGECLEKVSIAQVLLFSTTLVWWFSPKRKPLTVITKGLLLSHYIGCCAMFRPLMALVGWEHCLKSPNNDCEGDFLRTKGSNSNELKVNMK